MSAPKDRDQLDAALTPETLPYLARFLELAPGGDGSGAPTSVAAAAFELAAEGESEEVAALAGDWLTLRAAARALSLERVREILAQRFGSTWSPGSIAEIDAIGGDLERSLVE